MAWQGRRRLVAVVFAASVGTAAVLGLSACGGDAATASGNGGGTASLTFAATAPDGGAASADELDQAAGIVQARLSAAGLTDAHVEPAAGALKVTAPSGATDLVRALMVPGQLRIRPVVGGFGQGSPAPDLAARRKLEALDCTTATGRGVADPNAQLAACDQGGTVKYLLEGQILDGSAISKAVPQPPGAGTTTWSVEVEMTEAAGATWTAYTAAHTGGQVAITMDDVVISAPTIQGMITSATEIAGDFTPTTAQALAAILTSPALPVRAAG